MTLLEAFRNAKVTSNDEFVSSVLERAEKIAQERAAIQNSRFDVLPEPAKPFDLRLVEIDE